MTGFPTKMVNDFFVFEESVRDGVFLSAGDVNGDGFADLIAGGGPSGGPRVLVVDGQTLIKKGSSQLAPLANFFAGDDSLRTGVMVAAKDIDGDTRADIVVGLATQTGGTVVSFLGTTLTPTTAPPAKWTFDALVDPFSGPFVG